jgi:DNA excision repair protein ERCC-5
VWPGWGQRACTNSIRGGGKREKDLFELPDIPKTENEDSIDISSSDSETGAILENVGLRNVSDVYQVDVTSSRFTSLPTNVQYEVLNDLKGKKRQNSWAKIHQMPQDAEGFSGAPHTY